MSKTFEVANRISGHSFGFYAAADAGAAINACCSEAGYTDVRDFLESTGAEASHLVATPVAVIDAAPFAGHDDCLTAAAVDYAEKHGLQGWDLSPRWEDSQRGTIVLTVPA
jgi:hypothetical protein